jgi:hypothetical protein
MRWYTVAVVYVVCEITVSFVIVLGVLYVYVFN